MEATTRNEPGQSQQWVGSAAAAAGPDFAAAKAGSPARVRGAGGGGQCDGTS